MTTPETVRVRFATLAAKRVEPLRVDFGHVPGASLAAAEAWTQDELRLDVVCVRAPTTLWMPGLEATLLDAAAARSREVLELSALSPGALQHEGHGWRRTFEGTADGGRAVGRHELGFVGDARDLLVCSLACRGVHVEGCARALHGLTVEAAYVAPPPPGRFAKAFLSALERPVTAVASVGVVALVAVAVLLRFRPRPRRPRHLAHDDAPRRTT